MSHDHSHHKTTNYNSKFKIGIALNLIFVLVELSFGLIYNSLALIADAGHNLSDVVGLVIAWGASYLVKREPTKNFTYGFKKSSIIAAQLNSLILITAVGIIIWEAIGRFNQPVDVEGKILIIIAAIGILINGYTTYLFFGGKESDLNIKGAYLHMLSDTLVSVGVVISGFVILYTNFNWIDPIISISIALLIFWSTWKLLQESTKLSLDAVPEEVNIEEVKKFLLKRSDVNDVHDLHIWALSTTETALTVHLVMENIAEQDNVIKEINNDLLNKFNISHSTIQIEQLGCENGC